MMTCDKQNENFIKQQQQPSEDEKVNTKKIANTIINHKFNKTKNITNSQMMITENIQKQLSIKANTSGCIKEQKQQQQPTIISKVLTQELSIMAQQAMKQTHMTLKKCFEFSNDAANTTLTKTKATASKRINKNMNVKQNAQNIGQQDSNKAFSIINSGEHEYQLKLRPTFANTTDPADIIQNLATTSSSPSLSSSPLSISSILPPPTTDTVQATEFAIAATIPATEDVVENSQSKIQQCNNVCISSKCGSKQKCAQQQKQKQHCKISANISCSKNNFNNIRTFSKTNINTTHITECNADAVSTFTSPTQTAAVEGTKNTNIITTTSTTNKANIRFNTISSTTITATAIHTHNVAPITTKAADAATRPTELYTATAAAPPTTYCKAFPLRQRYYQNTKQLECLLRTVVFSFMFVMSMQYQTGK